MGYHRHLKDVVEDQMTLASIHYLRSHYQEAIDIYKVLLAKNREYTALNVYVALCYYKLDYYDVSQEVLAVYMQVWRGCDGAATTVPRAWLTGPLTPSSTSTHTPIPTQQHKDSATAINLKACNHFRLYNGKVRRARGVRRRGRGSGFPLTAAVRPPHRPPRPS